MTQSIRKRLRRFALFCLVTATTSGTFHVGQARAEDTHDSSQWCGWVEETPGCNSKQTVEIIDDDRLNASPQFMLGSTGEELPIDTCNYERWLENNVEQSMESADKTVQGLVQEQSSNLVKTNAKKPSTEATAKTRTSSDFNSTLATIAASVSSGNPVAFTHWTEPFAMVGPTCNQAAKEFKAFEAWVRQNYEEVASDTTEVSGPSRSEPSRPAKLNNEAELVIIETTPVKEPLAIDVPDPSSPDSTSQFAGAHLGTAPMIVTIEEAYAPYDMNEEDQDLVSELTVDVDPVDVDPVDVELTDSPPDVSPRPSEKRLVWTDSLLSPSRQPLCFHAFPQQCQSGWSPKAQQALPAWRRQMHSQAIEETVDTNEVASREAVDASSQVVSNDTSINAIDSGPWAGSAECWLDEFFWKVDEFSEQSRVVNKNLRPRKLGRRLASLVVDGDEFTSEVAKQLALVWPANNRPADPIPGSGAKLLARAEAAEQPAREGLADPFSDEQLAQVRATMLQWANVAQGVIDDLNVRIADVTEVARNRGTQDDSKVR